MLASQVRELTVSARHYLIKSQFDRNQDRWPPSDHNYANFLLDGAAFREVSSSLILLTSLGTHIPNLECPVPKL
jgi:hypothetical protein